LYATPQVLDQLKNHCGIDNAEGLETELKERIKAWLADIPDDDLLQHDVVTIKDLVFAQLRSW
jgi:hypothetical protein